MTQSSKPASQQWPKRRAWSPHLSVTAVLRCKGRSPRLNFTEILRHRAQNPHVGRFRVGIQNARLEARISTIEKPYVSVITALINGSITAHIMRGVNPHYRGFSGDSFTPKTLINSLVCYWRGVESFGRKDWNRSEECWRKSWTLLTTCWVISL